MNYIYHGLDDRNSYLSHHGIKGQKWGVRRWQNSDGSLTPEGYTHYGRGLPKAIKNYKANKINRDAKRISKDTAKLNKANDLYLKDQRREADAELKYSKAANKLNDTRQKLNVAENGTYAKLFGQDKYKINKLNTQIDKQARELSSIRDDYNKAKAYRYDTEISIKEIQDKLNKTSDRRNKNIEKFINQYSQEEYANLVA